MITVVILTLITIIMPGAAKELQSILGAPADMIEILSIRPA